MLTDVEIDHYQKNGYVVLRQFIEMSEIEMLRHEVMAMVQAAPVNNDSTVSMTGEHVEHPEDFSFSSLVEADQAQVLNRINYPLAHSRALRVAYANPKLMAAVEDICGANFLPFAESIVIKMPNCGAPFDWHQDGTFKTGWAPMRGVNFGIYLHASSIDNGCLYAVPGSHLKGPADIATMLDSSGMHLVDAIPIVAAPGDVIVHSRNLVHGSYANRSQALRVTVYFGFHQPETVKDVYTIDHIKRRAQMVHLAVEERQQHTNFLDEISYSYRGADVNVKNWTDNERQRLFRVPALAV